MAARATPVDSHEGSSAPGETLDLDVPDGTMTTPSAVLPPRASFWSKYQLEGSRVERHGIYRVDDESRRLGAMGSRRRTCDDGRAQDGGTV